jgi:2-iminobutanoate/2-iminopropanoate deaminase
MEKKAHDVDFLIKGGPYSHMIEANGFLFVSGMVPMDVEKGIMITDYIQQATELVLNNIKRALEAVGSNMGKVVKSSVFLRDMADFNAMNEVYKPFFPGPLPARTCVAVKQIPGNFPIEIEVIALK